MVLGLSLESEVNCRARRVPKRDQCSMVFYPQGNGKHLTFLNKGVTYLVYICERSLTAAQRIDSRWEKWILGEQIRDNHRSPGNR